MRGPKARASSAASRRARGTSDPDWRDDDPSTQEVDWSFFEERVWPALAHRVPAFEAIRPGRAWAGPYDMCLLDHNAIVGPAGAFANFYLCNGFSGHGLQQSPAVGRGLAELDRPRPLPHPRPVRPRLRARRREPAAPGAQRDLSLRISLDKAAPDKKTKHRDHQNG